MQKKKVNTWLASSQACFLANPNKKQGSKEQRLRQHSVMVFTFNKGLVFTSSWERAHQVADIPAGTKVWWDNIKW